MVYTLHQFLDGSGPQGMFGPIFAGFRTSFGLTKKQVLDGSPQVLSGLSLTTKMGIAWT